MLSLLIPVVLWFAQSKTARATTWDVVADYNPTTNNGDQVWQYGSTAADGSGFTHFTVTNHNSELLAWLGPLDSGVLKNLTRADKYYNICTRHPADVLGLYPQSNGSKVVVRWKAPASGHFLIQGRFQDVDKTTSDVSIVRNGNIAQPTFIDQINDTTCNATAVVKRFSFRMTLNAGDTIDFRVGWGSNNEYSYDGTGLAVEISDGTLWTAGKDLVASEQPDDPTENSATNAKVPEWSYGYRTTADGPDLTFFAENSHVNDSRGFEGWFGPDATALLVNAKFTPITLNAGFGDFKPLLPAQLYVHPGAGLFTVARWTAPVAADYRVLARWVDLDNHGGDGATAYVVQNGQVLFNETFRSTSTAVGRARLRARTLSLNAGDTLDFVLGPNGNRDFDGTAFNAAIRRVPKVTITSPASDPNAQNPIPASQDVHFTVDVQHSGPIADVMLLVDEIKSGPVDFTAPYSLQAHLPPGYHKVVVRATAQDGTSAESPEVVVVVAPPAAAQSKAAQDPDDGVSGPDASEAVGKLFYSVKGGGAPWNDPATWGSQSAVPGRWDYVLIQAGHHIALESGVQVRHLIVNGTLTGGLAAINPDLDVYGTLVVNGAVENLNLYIQPPAGKFLILRNSPALKFVNIINQNHFIITADKFNGEGVTLENRGTFKADPPFASQGPLRIPLDGFAQTGRTRLGADTVLDAPAGVKKLEGELQLSPDHTLPPHLAWLISESGSTLIGTDGATLIGTDGATLIGTDGATLIGTDGASLIGPDGVYLIGTDGATLIGTDGGSFGSTDSADAPRPATAEATTAGNIVLSGGTVSGMGELRGPVINEGAFIAPGNSPGGIVVNGDYTQQSNGTLVLEIGGKTLAPFAYDVFQVAGTANLGGNLVVKTINGYTPTSGDNVNPLLYGSHTGNFASVTSNAQVNLGPNGMQVTTDGTNPPPPKALNIATRMKVETGDNALIAGFIITGNAPKKVIIRGIGPSLPFAGVLADPTLSLDNGAITNDNWRSNQEQEIIDTTIPPSNNLESAIVATLSPGAHTAVLRGSGNSTGIGVIEVYDLESGSPVQLANISSRGLVQAGDNVMIGGFIIGGTYPAKVIVRAIGSSLPFAGKLENPTLEVVDQNGGRISNDNWRETQEAEVIATTIPPTNDNESAIVATLAPGAYTAVVRGADDTTGIAVVEAYNLSQ
ncbi:MAG TPA: hypothetical protein VM940_14380 [Chthoniobacterales bacterium]|nr:hypothetical protein [Chthoniobacterales bacterium]